MALHSFYGRIPTDHWHIPSPKETEQYHPYQNDYQRNSLINSKTISKAKRQKNMLQRLLIPKTLCPHEIAKITNVHLFSCVSSLFSSGMTHTRSWWVVRRAHIQAFTFFVALTLKIMVVYQSRMYPSIRAKTCADSQDHGRLPVVHISKRSPSLGADSQDRGRLPVAHVSKRSHRNLHTCWTPWSAR